MTRFSAPRSARRDGLARAGAAMLTSRMMRTYVLFGGISIGAILATRAAGKHAVRAAMWAALMVPCASW